MIFRYKSSAGRPRRLAVDGRSSGAGGGSVDKFTDVAFTAPDDGWAVGLHSAGDQYTTVYHYDGTSWSACSYVSVTGCDDGNKRLASVLGAGGSSTARASGASLRLVKAEDRVYLIGNRQTGSTDIVSATQSSTLTYPVIIYHDRGGPWRGGIDTSTDGAYDPTDGG